MQLSYIPDEPALLSYARSLDVDEREAAANHLPPMDAAATLIGALAQSYAVTTHHNRRINQQRGLCRSIAGLAILGSVFLTMFLVARLLLHYMPNGN